MKSIATHRITRVAGCIVAACLLLAPLAVLCGEPDAITSAGPLMPRAGDYTLMWWAEGFPAHTPGAPWRRVMQGQLYETDAMDPRVIASVAAVLAVVALVACVLPARRAASTDPAVALTPE